MIRVVCVSDTHGRHRELELPPGDILVYAGDITRRGEHDTLVDFDDWLGTVPHPHKVVICGNHDFCFENAPAASRAMVQHAFYLQDELVEVAGLRIYGSPWQPWYGGWAFNLHRGPDIVAKWKLIPDRVDILLTHGPPAGVLDMTVRGVPAGCQDLLDRVAAARPRLHVFGHIHEAHGVLERDGTTFVNAAVYGGRPPVVIDLETR